ncbi:phage tail tape measure protein [Roseospira visakhapatnamensis]|uniref:TP901 family phage tail tape measure protein n=1 Tax=Roseospira visakhapatnamensis TaxID=390880 RepID=A0A7W6RGH8_9PROT|nr:phage tail tape measure protein [Roseospira visakhapatnamensis]MBB4268149.1 TP901 family phage tail tape measure protein [Roseospira visakhapatnamensis]
MAGDAHQTVSVELRAETEGFRRSLQVSREDWEAWRQAANQAGDQARDTGQGLEALGQEAREAARGADALGDQTAQAARQVDTLGDQAAQAARHADTMGDQAARAARQVDTLGDRAGQSARQVDSLGRQVDQLGAHAGRVRTLVGGLAAAAAGLGALRIGRDAVQSWVDYEAALVGVGKVTDLAGADLRALGDDIAALALRPEMGATTLELLDIAQAAGQLGVDGAANIEHFTATIAMLQGATDLVGGEGAMQLARILTVTGEGEEAVDRLASSVVALGNSFAATESEIVHATTYVAQATALYDVSSAQAAGLAAALTAMGVRAELAGGAVGRAFQAINDAVRQGGDELRALVDLTGRSAEDLREAFAEDAMGVFEDVVEALAEVREAGDDVGAVLTALGLTAGEDTRVMGALAAGVETVTGALNMSGVAWDENTALWIEAARAAETAEARFTVFRNTIGAIQRTLGEALTPALVAAAAEIQEMILAARDSGQLAAWASGAASAVTALAEAAVWAADHADILIAAAAGLAAVALAKWALEAAAALRALAVAAWANPYVLAAAALVALGVAAYDAATETRAQQQAIVDLHADLDTWREKTDGARDALVGETEATADSTRELLANTQARLEAVKAQMAFWDANDPDGLRARFVPGYQAGEDAGLAALRQERARLEADIVALQDQLAEVNDRRRRAGTAPPGDGGPPSSVPSIAPPGAGDEAWADWVAQTERATAAAQAMAGAVDQGAAAIQAAEVAAAAEILVLQHGAARRAEIVALLTQEAAARQALAVAQTIESLDRQIEAEQALAAAHRQGRDAVREANVENRVAETLARLNIEAGSAEAEVIREKVAAAAAAAEATQRAAEASQSADAWARWVDQTELATRSAQAMAIAVGQGAAAIQAAEVAAAAEGLVLQHGAGHRERIVTLLTQEAAARQALAVAQAVVDLDRQIEAEQALTAARLAGRDAVAAANVERQAADVLARHNIESGSAEAEVIREKVAALAEETEARERAEALGDMRDRLDGLKAEAAWLVAVTRQRALSRAELEAIQSLTARGIDLTSEHARQERALAKAIADQTRATERARAAATDWADGATQAIHDYQVAVLDSAAVTEDAFTGVFSSWEDSLADFIAEFDWSIDAAKTLIEDLGDAVLSEIARIAARSIVGGVTQPIGALFGVGPAGTPAGAAPAGGAAGTAYPVAGPAGGMNTMSVLSTGMAGNAIFNGSTLGTDLVTGSIGQSLGLYTPPGFMGLDAGMGVMTDFGSALAGGLNAAPWGIVGSLGANLLGFQGSGDPFIDLGLQGGGAVLGGIGGTALGGAIGGQIFGATTGSVLGPVGAIGGAFLGTMLGDLFAPTRPHPAGGGHITVDPDGTVSTGHYFGKHTDLAAQQAAVDPFGTFVQQIMDLTDARLSGALDMAISADDGEFRLTTPHTRVPQDLQPYVSSVVEGQFIDFTTMEAAQSAYLRALGIAIEDMPDASRVLQDVTPDNIETVLPDLSFVMEFETALAGLAEGVTDWSTSVRAQTEANLGAAADTYTQFLDDTARLMPERMAEADAAVKQSALMLVGLADAADQLNPEIQAFIGQTEGLRDQFSAVMGAAGWTDESIGAAGFASLAEAETEAVRRSLEGWLETVALTHDGAAALAEAFGDIPGVLDMLVADVEATARALEDAWTDREHAATGQGYLTTLDALAADYEAGLTAAAETGADASALARAVTAEIAAAVSGLDASALADLIDQFAATGIVATGLSQALHDLEVSAARARDAAVAQERATLDASLWRLTGNTAAIRAAEIAAATPENRDMVRYLHQVRDLLAAHGEAATIAREAAEAQVDAAREAYAAWRETDAARREALAEAVATWADLARVADGVGADLRRWLDGLDTGAASTLAPRARAAVHGEASAGRRTDGGLTQVLVDELRALRRDLGAQTGRADLAARAAVGGRRA